MRVFKVSLLSLLTLILSTFHSWGHQSIPDSIRHLVQSKHLAQKATGWQKAIQFYFDQNDSINYSEALKQFHQLNLEKLEEVEKRKIYSLHSSFLLNSFQYDLAKPFLLKAINNAIQKQEMESEALFHQILAPHYFYSYHYDSCDIHLDRAIELYTEFNNSKEIGELTIRKSGSSYAKGNYELAIEYAYEAIEIFRETGNKEKLAVAYLQLGNIFYFLEDYSESMQYYKLSLSAFKANSNDEGIYRALSNIGLVNLMQKNYRISINQQLEAIQYFELKNKDLEKGNSYLFLSDGYWGIEKYDSAKYYNQLSIETNQKTKYFIGLGQGYLMKSKILEKEDNPKEALKAAIKAMAIADSVQQYESIKDAAKQLANTYSALGEIDSSYHYMKVHANLQDSLDIDPQILRDYAMKHQFQIEEVKFELLLAKEKAQIQEQLHAKKASQLIIAISIAVSALVLLILAIIILYRNKLLSKQLTEKQDQIKSELMIKESLLNEIHHRVKNNLQVISSMLSLQTRYIDSDQVQKVISDCKGRINSMSLIHESLYKKTDGIEAPFSEYIKTLIPQLIKTYQVDELKIKAIMELEEIQLNLDESIPCGLLINEIVSNSLKHAFPDDANGEINIKLKKMSDIIHLEISDNGIGHDSTDIEQNEESFGFLLIETLVQQLEATMEISNDSGLRYDIKWKSIS